ncbi:GGDEF domain-containing protein [Pseudoalteromonas sp. A41-2]|uniref:GGDEF domain-containing protein n=1 Tax=unclassified Pseudoalteromonas TaxID=194690 RepID=UPI00094F6A02|nr:MULTISPECIES: GGDEF domain-containing protein [unclassified Pseudoalteromonas]QPL41898.1 GGDEF domain-containing protein [Pseudoalteromonas sp. A41-2]
MVLSAQAAHSLGYSSHCLKLAIPLMVKYKIPITPLNYAIWYCYVSDKNHDLNKELDGFISRFNGCSYEQANYLFNKYLSANDLSLFYQLSNSFDDVVGQVQHDLTAALNQSTQFNQVLYACRGKLHDADISKERGFDDVLHCVERLTNESAALQNRTQDFQNQLALAYAKIITLKQELIDSKRKAEKDTLTGLFNRGKFDEDITVFCQRDDLAEIAVLVMVDIDHFKVFNDTFGHQKGDQVLRAVAVKLLKYVASVGQVYRYGGEEFCFTAQFTSISDMTNFTQQLRLAITKLHIKDPASTTVLGYVTASFGVAIKSTNSQPNQLIKKADKALYLAKKHGRNRIEIIEE